LFPGLSDEATRQEATSKLAFDAPGKQAWPLQQEAIEVAWYLGSPFLVQVVEATEGHVAGVVAGPMDTSSAGQRLLDAYWRVEVERAADVVVAGISGDPANHTFLDLARAFACAARVVKPNGRIVLLTEAAPELGRSAEIMRLTEDPGKTLSILSEEKPADHEAGFLWAHAAQKAKLCLLSRLPDEVTEELFAVPLASVRDVERIVSGDVTCLFLPDAHKTMAVLSPR
jgi:nickel-dependent lactate racemase